MRRTSKSKRNKVPKISEEEYAKYISALRNEPIKEKERESPLATKQAENKTEI